MHCHSLWHTLYWSRLLDRKKWVMKNAERLKSFLLFQGCNHDPLPLPEREGATAAASGGGQRHPDDGRGEGEHFLKSRDAFDSSLIFSLLSINERKSLKKNIESVLYGLVFVQLKSRSLFSYLPVSLLRSITLTIARS